MTSDHRFARLLGGRCQMQAEETVRVLLETLPVDFRIDDVLYHLYVIQTVERGIEDADAGRLIPHETVVDELRKW